MWFSESAFIAMFRIPFRPKILRERSPFPFTLMCGYTNGWRGYVPTRDAFPVGGYEVEWGSAFDVGAADVLIEGSLALLEDLR